MPKLALYRAYQSLIYIPARSAKRTVLLTGRNLPEEVGTLVYIKNEIFGDVGCFLQFGNFLAQFPVTFHDL